LIYANMLPKELIAETRTLKEIGDERISYISRYF
jgi:hypothetical protein